MTDLLNEIMLLVDFGLVVLIWIVQLVIYPSFKYYTPEDLVVWHEKYTRQITLVVLPLMTIQLVTHVLHVSYSHHIWSWLSGALVLMTWVSTFLYAVPRHHKIGKKEELDKNISSLIHVNAWRTLVWNAIFFISWLFS